MSEKAQNATDPAEPPTPVRIMIVEDEPDIATILKQLLGSRYEVVHACNGLEALERLNWYEPDLTIMDLMMPVLNGIDTTRAIKKDNDYAAMPVLFLTARKDNRSVREALMAGGDVYLEKPFDPRELFTRVEEMITRNQVRPVRKRYSMEQIRAHFDGAAAKPAEPRTSAEPAKFSLTEQLARAAAVPRVRILAVHDVPDALSALQKSLRNHFEFIGVRDAETALDKIAAYQPDVLLLSSRGSSISGILLTHLLRINRHFKVTAVVLLFETDHPDHMAEAARLGIHVLQWKSGDTEPILALMRDITSAPGFQRLRKRLDYREILRREEPEENDY
jgi:DNA-binding response OmpR family regulator